MTQSELLAMMVGGMATISGGVMAVYIALGADPVAILTTSVMAAPCGLYLSKILYPGDRGAGDPRARSRWPSSGSTPTSSTPPPPARRTA